MSDGAIVLFILALAAFLVLVVYRMATKEQRQAEETKKQHENDLYDAISALEALKESDIILLFGTKKVYEAYYKRLVNELSSSQLQQIVVK